MERKEFIWQEKNWTDFHVDTDKFKEDIDLFMKTRSDLFDVLPPFIDSSALADTIISTSAIEGVIYDRDSVIGSLTRRLHRLKDKPYKFLPQEDESVIDFALTIISQPHPLKVEDLHRWHTLIPLSSNIKRGVFREEKDGPMQIVSGPIGKDIVHFEAPPANQILEEMTKLIDYINKTEPTIFTAGIAHLWFVTIHPYLDGNGRMARAISDWILGQAKVIPIKKGLPCISVSREINFRKSEYYRALENTQRGYFPIEAWITLWFKFVIDAHITSAKQILALTQRAYFFSTLPIRINDRQKFMLNKIFDGFEGHITTKKWATLTKTSLSTAQRDINELEAANLLQSTDNARATKYMQTELLNLEI